MDLKAGVVLALPDLTVDRANIVRQLNRAGIPVTAGLTLPAEQGYYLNASNGREAEARFEDFEKWSTANGLRWAAIGLAEITFRQAQEATSRRGPDELNTGCRLQRQNIQMRDLYHPLNSCGAQVGSSGRMTEATGNRRTSMRATDKPFDRRVCLMGAG